MTKVTVAKSNTSLAEVVRSSGPVTKYVGGPLASIGAAAVGVPGAFIEKAIVSLKDQFDATPRKVALKNGGEVEQFSNLRVNAYSVPVFAGILSAASYAVGPLQQALGLPVTEASSFGDIATASLTTAFVVRPVVDGAVAALANIGPSIKAGYQVAKQALGNK